jgi:hypothetical protein
MEGVGRNKKRLLGKKPKWWEANGEEEKGALLLLWPSKRTPPIFSILWPMANYANGSQICRENQREIRE